MVVLDPAPLVARLVADRVACVPAPVLAAAVPRGDRPGRRGRSPTDIAASARHRHGRADRRGLPERAAHRGRRGGAAPPPGSASSSTSGSRRTTVASASARPPSPRSVRSSPRAQAAERRHRTPAHAPAHPAQPALLEDVGPARFVGVERRVVTAVHRDARRTERAPRAVPPRRIRLDATSGSIMSHAASRAAGPRPPSRRRTDGRRDGGRPADRSAARCTGRRRSSWRARPPPTPSTRAHRARRAAARRRRRTASTTRCSPSQCRSSSSTSTRSMRSR